MYVCLRAESVLYLLPDILRANLERNFISHQALVMNSATSRERLRTISQKIKQTIRGIDCLKFIDYIKGHYDG